MSGFNNPGATAASGGGADWSPGFVVGNWYLVPAATQAAGTSGGFLNTICWQPFMLGADMTVSDLATRINTGTGGANIQLAIYAAHATTHKPTGNVIGATASIVVAAGGAFSAAIAGGSKVLTKGTLYYVGINTDNGAVRANFVAGTPLIGSGTNLVGSATLASVLNVAGSVNGAYTTSQTFGTWPDVTGASFVESSVGPSLALKAA